MEKGIDQPPDARRQKYDEYPGGNTVIKYLGESTEYEAGGKQHELRLQDIVQIRIKPENIRVMRPEKVKRYSPDDSGIKKILNWRRYVDQPPDWLAEQYRFEDECITKPEEDVDELFRMDWEYEPGGRIRVRKAMGKGVRMAQETEDRERENRQVVEEKQGIIKQKVRDGVEGRRKARRTDKGPNLDTIEERCEQIVRERRQRAGPERQMEREEVLPDQREKADGEIDVTRKEAEAGGWTTDGKQRNAGNGWSHHDCAGRKEKESGDV